MKGRISWLAAFVLLAVTTFAQILNPVKWSFNTEYTKSGEVILVSKATIEEGWHLYSQFLDGDEGPIATSFKYTSSDNFVTVDNTKEGKAHKEYDKNFEMELAYFEKSASFRQKIDSKGSKPYKVKGELEFMVCNDVMCLPPDFVEFTFSVDPAKIVKSKVEATPKEEIITTETAAVVDESAATEENDAEEIVEVVVEETQPETAEITTASAAAPAEDKKEESLWGIFLLGFGGGFVALLMPCIFPMIPLTVSFFTKQSKTKAEGIRKAILYGIGIIVIYVALGMLVTLATGDSSALNAMSTNPWFNLVFFALFVVFAMSFFGAFEITLPSSWVNKAENASDKGGLIGIFFMAFTLALVSFSCTGPIIGTLLVDAATKGSYMGPAIGMFGFSLALALPFTLFAAFPGWLNSMPKSGGWLNTVKVTLGFLELAFALKFLSTADLVWQTHWLHREVFLAIWTGIAFMTAAYLLGLFTLPHDSKVDRIGVGRLMVAVVFTVMGFYLLPGIFGAPVKLVAGFPPPEFYSEKPGGAFSGHSGAAVVLEDLKAGEKPTKFGDHCPHNLPCFNNFEDGLAYAKKVNKPIMIDFTGWGCVNCRKMEEQVWSDPTVLAKLRDDVVLVSLYVDERTELPAEEQYISEVTGKKVRTIGNKWSDFQAKNYQANAQPYYVILGHDDLKPLHEHAAYDPNIPKFVDWLDRGVKLFEESKK